MYHLIQFIVDKVYYICRDSHIKKIKSGRCLARWCDGHYYKSNLIFSSESFHIIHSFYVNLENNFPLVSLRRLNEPMPGGYPISDSTTSNSDDSNDRNYELSAGSESDESCITPFPMQLKDLPSPVPLPSSISDIELENLSVPEQANNQSFIINISADHMQIDNVQLSSNKSKQYFCVFCNKLVTKFARHIQTVHHNETQIQHIFGLPKGKFISYSMYFTKISKWFFSK